MQYCEFINTVILITIKEQSNEMVLWAHVAVVVVGRTLMTHVHVPVSFSSFRATFLHFDTSLECPLQLD